MYATAEREIFSQKKTSRLKNVICNKVDRGEKEKKPNFLEHRSDTRECQTEKQYKYDEM